MVSSVSSIEPRITRRRALARPSAKSALSAAFGLIVLAGLVLAATKLDWSATRAVLRAADGRLVLVALTVFYLGFLARTWRWQVLLENTGWSHTRQPAMPGYRGLTAIMYRGWVVNAVTIARAGDAYRVLKLRQRAQVPVAQSTGTLVTERVVDMVVLAGMLVPSVLLSFHRTLPAVARWTLGVAAVAAIAGPILLISARRAGSIGARFAPIRFRETIELLTDGIAGSLGRYPLVLGLTLFGWLGECAMVLFSARAVGIQLPFEQAAMVALVTAMLSIIPITPGGLGVADAGIVLLLGQVGIPIGHATAIAVIVRAISLGSVVVGGGLLWLIGGLRDRRNLHLERTRQWA